MHGQIHLFYVVSETQMPQHPMTKQEKSVSTHNLDKKPGICSATADADFFCSAWKSAAQMIVSPLFYASLPYLPSDGQG